ncbi:GGDEF domain-containing protein [Shewanella sp. SR44-3]|uniref:diguanylate cyclase DgcS n=1 Tax=unclassified Shewanella TaxID=196818 RepID=UPI0015FDCB64|nr:GGDEF domain-containing protein [Shewanella sp. SR44-3]MBB1268169.1 GGDEF domain-containing protein [Shewanella sp. SR44-3]
MDFALATQLYPEEYWYQSDSYLKDEPEFDLIQVIQQLHASLEPRTVFACFGKLIGQQLPIQGVQLSVEQKKLSWGRHHGLSLQRTLLHNDTSMVFQYQLSVPLTPLQLVLLEKVEPLFALPFINALKYQKMANQAMFDALTGLGNRHYYGQSIHNALARAQRKHGNVSLVVLDLDRFKNLNDEFGHKLGDTVLIEFANVINKAIRNTDQAFRIGGDEFVIIVQGDEDAAGILCQRIMEFLPANPVLNQFNVQTSMGIAGYKNAQSPEQLYEFADKALYSAKADGRNGFKIDKVS